MLEKIYESFPFFFFYRVGIQRVFKLFSASVHREATPQQNCQKIFLNAILKLKQFLQLDYIARIVDWRKPAMMKFGVIYFPLQIYKISLKKLCRFWIDC